MATSTAEISTKPPRVVSGSHYDAVVVGAGVMGSCAAHHLAKRGKKVLLLEQFELLHRRGSSHGDSRIIRRTYPESVNTEMMMHAYPLWESAQREAGQSVYTKTGGLDWGKKGSKDIESLLASCRRFNVEVEVMDATQANARFPRQLKLPSDFIAVYNSDGGVIHATQAVAMFQRLAMANGAEVIDRTKVVAITTPEDDPRSAQEATAGGDRGRGGDGVGSAKGGRVQVTTARGDTVTATSCVVTCGAWAGKLLRHLGYATALQPIHTTYAFWRCHFPADFTPPRWPVFIHYDEVRGGKGVTPGGRRGYVVFKKYMWVGGGGEGHRDSVVCTQHCTAVHVCVRPNVQVQRRCRPDHSARKVPAPVGGFNVSSQYTYLYPYFILHTYCPALPFLRRGSGQDDILHPVRGVPGLDEGGAAHGTRLRPRHPLADAVLPRVPEVPGAVDSRVLETRGPPRTRRGGGVHVHHDARP